MFFKHIIFLFAKIKFLKMTDSIATRVMAIIMDKLAVDAEAVSPEASFSDDLGADSLDVVELIMEFEKEFDIEISDDDAEKIMTVHDAIKYIESKV